MPHGRSFLIQCEIALHLKELMDLYDIQKLKFFLSLLYSQPIKQMQLKVKNVSGDKSHKGMVYGFISSDPL